MTQEPAPANVPMLESPPENCNVLIVDDDRVMAKLLQRVLQSIGVEANYLTQSKDVSAYLAVHSVDVILADMHMPEMSGLELLRQVRSQQSTAHLPFIVVTSDDNREVLRQCFAEGVSDFVRKPFDPVILQARLMSVWERSKAERALHEHQSLLEQKVQKATAELQERNAQLVQEVEHRKQTETELRENQETLQLAAEVGKIGVWRWDIAEKKSRWNERMLQLHAVDQALLPSEVFAMIPDAHRSFVARRFQELQDKGELPLTEYPIETELGLRWAQSVGKRFGTERAYAVGISVDVTERKEREVLLAEADRFSTLSNVAGGIAHELRNPLNVIYMQAELIEEMLEPEHYAVVEELVDVIRSQVERCGSIVRNLTTFSRRTDSSERIQAVTRDLIEGSVLLVKYDYRKAKVELDVQMEDATRMLLCNPIQIQQILVNLLNNALQATQGRPEPQVQLVCSWEANHWVTVVRDNGKGIKPEDLKRIFEPLFTTKPIGEGTGLGLSVSYNFVKEHQGTLEVESEVGVGTTFRLQIPVENK